MAATSRSDERIRLVATGISAARMGVGVLAILAPGLLRRVMSLPAEHDSPSLEMISRLFGVREVAVGAQAIGAIQSSPRQPNVYALNAAVDAGDAAMMLITAARGGGARRAAIGGFLTAVPVVGAWLWLRRASLDD